MAQPKETRSAKHKLDEIPSTSEPNVRANRNKRKKTESEESTLEEFNSKFAVYEKVDLFNGLIQHGSSNISKLQSYVPNKTLETIKRFIYACKRKSRYILSEGKLKAPIDLWLDFLVQDPKKEAEKLNDLSRALKYIHLFEPCGAYNQTMLSESYLVLSDFMKGEAPKHLNPVNSLFMYNKLQELIRLFKTQDYKAENKYLETCINKKKPTCYSGKKKVSEENKEIDPRISNPLKIPDSLLDLKK